MGIAAAVLLLFCDDVSQSIEKFQKEFQNKDAEARELAVKDLAIVKHDKVFQLLVGLMDKDVENVRLAAVEGVSHYDVSESTTAAMANAMKSNQKDFPKVTAALITAGASMKDRRLMKMIDDYLKSEETPIAKAAVLAAAKFNDRLFMDNLLDLLERLEKMKEVTRSELGRAGVPRSGATQINKKIREKKKELTEPTMTALKTISGKSFATSAEYKKWWEENKNKKP